MYVWQNTIVDEVGDVRPNARVEVRDAATLELATIYADEDGINERPNPFRSAAGFARFYAEAGRYQVTALDDSLERVFENVQLGFTLAALPLEDLEAYIASVCEPLAAAAIAELVPIQGLRVAAVGAVNANGSAAQLPDGMTSSRTVNTYRVTHNLGLAPTAYAALLSPTVLSGHANPQPTNYQGNFFEYVIFDDESNAIGAPVRFAIVTNEELVGVVE